MKKKYALLLLVILIAISSQKVMAKNYTALGDSIAYGYGLEDASMGYTAIVSGKVALEVKNHAVNGMTSSELYYAVDVTQPGDGLYEDIRDAALVTVSIGSNNLLGPLIRIAGKNLYSPNAENSYAELEKSLTSDDAKKTFQEGIDDYKSDLPKIYERIRSINPECQIIMTSFYNPYYGVKLGDFDFATLCDSYIKDMNGVLDDGKGSMKYDIADEYDEFNAPGLTNAAVNMDPHPNPAGHAIIAEKVISEIDNRKLEKFTPNKEDAPNTLGEIDEDPDENKKSKKSVFSFFDDEDGKDSGTDKFLKIGMYLAVGLALIVVIVGAVRLMNKKGLNA